MLFAGRRPIKPSTLLKENGEMTKSPLEVKIMRALAFQQDLNYISSQYQQEVLDNVPLQPIVHDLDGPPTLDELLYL